MRTSGPHGQAGEERVCCLTFQLIRQIARCSGSVQQAVLSIQHMLCTHRLMGDPVGTKQIGEQSCNRRILSYGSINSALHVKFMEI